MKHLMMIMLMTGLKIRNHEMLITEGLINSDRKTGFKILSQIGCELCAQVN